MAELISLIPGISPWLIIALIAWALPWKGVALWKSARNKQIFWFVILLITNTLAILEIVYLAFWQKPSKAKAKPRKKSRRK